VGLVATTEVGGNDLDAAAQVAQLSSECGEEFEEFELFGDAVKQSLRRTRNPTHRVILRSTVGNAESPCSVGGRRPGCDRFSGR
jgi:hypothetical protein